jgi:hypothetical protein
MAQVEHAASRSWLWCTLAAAAVVAPVADAQSSDSSQWHFIVEPYLMLANIHGTTGLGTLPDASVDESPSDIFKHVQFGAMLYAEAHNDRWAISSDLMYMNLAEDTPVNALITYGRVDLKQLGWELALLHRFSPWLEAGAGTQLNNIESDVRLSFNTPRGVVSRAQGLTETWVDPMIIARATFPLAEKWTLILRTNVGGFGIVSEFAWQAQLYAAYHISNGSTFSFGYRAIGDDYRTGSGDNRFVYDVITFGPVVRFAFSF